MPGALSYLIEKVEGLEKTAQSLLNRQEECCSPHWMDVDELCDYIPSHPVKQTVYGWVSDKQIPHHKINKALVFLQSEIDDWMKHCGNKSIEKQIQNITKITNNMKKKAVPAILIHLDWIETIKCLSHEQIGTFIIAMLDYANTGKEPKFKDNSMQALFISFKKADRSRQEKL